MKVRARPYNLKVRLMVLAGVLGACGVVLVGRAAQMQLLNKDFYQHQGDQRFLRDVPIATSRGMIMDRNGEPLAVSTPVESVWANPKELLQHADRLPELAEALGIPQDVLTQSVAQRADKEFMFLRRRINPDDAEAVVKHGIPGVYKQREFRRFYPHGEVMAHVLGFTNIDDHGQEGIELAFDNWLTGKPGEQRVIRDRRGHVVENVDLIRAAEPGKDITLSIDRRIQYLAYRELKAALIANGAASGSVVVIDIPTGEILAMVNQPAYNPNAREAAEPGTHRNRAVTDVVEPGSVIKPFTVVAALEAGLDPKTIVQTSPGWMMLGKYRISDVHDHGAVDLTHLLSTSSNIGAAKLGLGMTSEHLYDVLHRFGYGESTHSGFPGESSGVMAPPQTWGMVKRGSISYGMGLSVTPVQLAQAYAALANHGHIMPPTFIKGGARQGPAGHGSDHRAQRPDDAAERDRSRRHRAARGDRRLSRGRQDRHRAPGQRRWLCQALRVGVRRRGAARPSEIRDGGDHQQPARSRLLRRPGLRAGIPQRHGRRAPLDGRAAGLRRAVVCSQARGRHRCGRRCRHWRDRRSGRSRDRGGFRHRRHPAARHRRGCIGPSGGRALSAARSMPLDQLLAGQATLPAGFNPAIRGLSADSRDLHEGDAFIALGGGSTHGLRFVEQARAAKVAAILFEAPAPASTPIPAEAVAVDGLRGKLGLLADRFYDAPSRALSMTGVTGTNGKTSTVQLIAQALSLGGNTVGTIGTLGAGLYGEHVAGERTTPDVIAVHRLLAQMRDQGASHVAMEVSSHALEQGRVDNVAFRVAVFTNLTRDHLDYHGTMEAYGAAKARLLGWPTLQAVVINLDDEFGRRLLDGVAAGVQRIGVSSRGASGAALRAELPRLSPQGLAVHVERGRVRHSKSPRRCSADSTSTTCWPSPAPCARSAGTCGRPLRCCRDLRRSMAA